MFGFGPAYSMLVMARWVHRSAPMRIRRSVGRTNAALVLSVGTLCLLLGWREVLLVEAPLIALAGATGLWLFYVQHQFEETYWRRSEEWSYTDAALRGSSYLDLPRILQFFTGNIGFHHVHHLNPKIPNYNLQRVAQPRSDLSHRAEGLAPRRHAGSPTQALGRGDGTPCHVVAGGVTSSCF